MVTINSEAGNGARIQSGLNTQAAEGADSEGTRALAFFSSFRLPDKVACAWPASCQ